jgi:hypothetical protein
MFRDTICKQISYETGDGYPSPLRDAFANHIGQRNRAMPLINDAVWEIISPIQEMVSVEIRLGIDFSLDPT